MRNWLIALIFAPLPAWAVSVPPTDDMPSQWRASLSFWEPDVAPSGPLTVVVNLHDQRAYAYRNGVRIGGAEVSSGRRDYETPTGSFTVLERDRFHRSRKYDNAPMPYTLRLTWGGISLHGGGLPGRPSSHGCVHLPMRFAATLFDQARLGMPVTIIDRPLSRTVLDPALASEALPTVPGQSFRWNPERSQSGPVTILASASDQSMVVVRNGVVIGRAQVDIPAGTISGTRAVEMQGRDSSGAPQWTYLGLPGQESDQGRPFDRNAVLHVPAEFLANVDAILSPGATMVMTDEPLAPGHGTSSLAPAPN
jgi:hypothetical protein